MSSKAQIIVLGTNNESKFVIPKRFGKGNKFNKLNHFVITVLVLKPCGLNGPGMLNILNLLNGVHF